MRYICVALFLLCVSISLAETTRNEVLPAGTLMHCTISEPNFSARTALAGDPLLCHLGPLAVGRHSFLPGGAELSGHLEDFKAPGHLVGKGWLNLQFDRLVLPGGDIRPISTKILSLPNLKVDKEGKIHGRGHAKRDAIEWMIPLLWPMKIVTLPARGPYPTLKGETRLLLRLMEDVDVEFPAAAGAATGDQPSTHRPVLTPPVAAATDDQPSTHRPVLAPPVAATTDDQPSAHRLVLTPPAVATTADPPPARPMVAPGLDNHQGARLTVPFPSVAFPLLFDDTHRKRPTLIILKDGSGYLAQQYWIENMRMRCIGSNGEEKRLALGWIDFNQTVRLNRERGVPFIITNLRPEEQDGAE
jgi:hypothetical protein